MKSQFSSWIISWLLEQLYLNDTFDAEHCYQNILPQFHIIYDNFITSICNAENRSLLKALKYTTYSWVLFLLGKERYEFEIQDHAWNLVPPPELDNEWLIEPECHEKEQRRGYGFVH